MKWLIVTVLMIAAPAEAQNRPRPEVRIMGGFTGFLDEDSFAESSAGAAVRFYATRRVSFEPEFLYMVGTGTVRDFTFIPHVSYDFNPGRAVRPYVIGGAGVLFHRSDFIVEPGRVVKFRDTEWTVNGGLGVKVYLTPRVFIEPEFRLGFETIYRAAGSIGFVF